MGANSSAAARRMKVGIPAGPEALKGLRSLRSFTPFGLTLKSSIDEKGLGPLSGMQPGSTLM